MEALNAVFDMTIRVRLATRTWWENGLQMDRLPVTDGESLQVWQNILTTIDVTSLGSPQLKRELYEYFEQQLFSQDHENLSQLTVRDIENLRIRAHEVLSNHKE